MSLIAEIEDELEVAMKERDAPRRDMTRARAAATGAAAA